MIEHHGPSAVDRRASWSGRRARRWLSVVTGCGMCLCHGTRAETIALWLFDEPLATSRGSVLKDAGPKRYPLLLGRGAEIVPGKFGNALHVLVPPRFNVGHTAVVGGQGNGPDFAALFTSGDARLGLAPLANPTDSKLNLDADDWTIEAWLRIDAAADAAGTIFEIGTGPRGENELVTRVVVVPRENAFVLTTLSPTDDAQLGATTARIEFVNPEGPPAGVAFVRSTTLVAVDGSLPREQWFHVALVHSRATEDVRLFLDGKPQAAAPLKIRALPHGDRAYVAIGSDGRGQRPLAGAMDELRVSDRAEYVDAFTPRSLSRAPRQRLGSAAGAAGDLLALAANAGPPVTRGGGTSRAVRSSPRSDGLLHRR